MLTSQALGGCVVGVWRIELGVTIYSDDELDLSPLRDKTVAVLGYGNQGHAHALPGEGFLPGPR